MGEVAEMMLDGTLCEGCGEYMGEGNGFVRRCAGCAPAAVAVDIRHRMRPNKNKKRADKIVQCDRGCRKWFVSKAAVEQHARDKHPK